MTRRGEIALFLSLLVMLAPLFSPLVPGAEPTPGAPKNPKKIADGYTGKFDPTGSWVAYINVHDALLHVVSTDTGIDINSGVRPFGSPYDTRNYCWDGGILRVLTSDFHIVRTDSGFKPQTTIALKGAGELLQDKYADAALNPIEDCACGIFEDIIMGDPAHIFYRVNLYSPYTAPASLIPSNMSYAHYLDLIGIKALLGWDASGQHFFYSIMNGHTTYMVDRDGTNTTLVINWSLPQMDMSSGKVLYHWSPTGQIAVQDVDNSTGIRFLNQSEGWGWSYLNAGVGYRYESVRGIVELNLTTLDISLRWPWAIEHPIYFRDIFSNEALVYCEDFELWGCETIFFKYGLYLIDMTIPPNIASEDFLPMRDFYTERAPEVKPDLSYYHFAATTSPLIILPLALLVILHKRRARWKPGRASGPTV